MSDITEAMRIPDDAEELRERVIGANCPRCGAHDVDYESVEVDTGTAYQRGDCVKCDFTWHEHYEIAEITYPDPEDDTQETRNSVRADDPARLELVELAKKYRREAIEQGANESDVEEIDAVLRLAEKL